MCPHPPQRQHRIGFPFLPLNGPAAEVFGPLYLIGVAGAELDSLRCPVCFEDSALWVGACAAFDTAFKHLSSFDSIAATLATMGLGSLDRISTLSGELAKLAALLRAALPFSASTSAAYAACSKFAYVTEDWVYKYLSESFKC